jgi:hypothetical protein
MSLSEKLKFSVATIETPNFSFSAFGRTEMESLDAMLKGLEEHRRQTGLPKDWPEKTMESVNVFEASFGDCLRDREALTAL